MTRKIRLDRKTLSPMKKAFQKSTLQAKNVLIRPNIQSTTTRRAPTQTSAPKTRTEKKRSRTSFQKQTLQKTTNYLRKSTKKKRQSQGSAKKATKISATKTATSRRSIKAQTGTSWTKCRRNTKILSNLKTSPKMPRVSMIKIKTNSITRCSMGPTGRAFYPVLRILACGK